MSRLPVRTGARGSDRVAKRGGTVVTTIDPKLQEVAFQALNQALNAGRPATDGWEGSSSTPGERCLKASAGCGNDRPFLRQLQAFLPYSRCSQ